MKQYLRKIVPMVLGAVLSIGAVATASAADVSQTSVLTGKTLSVVAVGTAVKEGDTLVTVQSLTGPIAAARATVAAAASCRTSGLPIAAAAAVTLGAIELLVGLLQALFQFLSRGLMDTRAERQWRCADGVLDVRTLCAQLLQAVRQLGGG